MFKTRSDIIRSFRQSVVLDLTNEVVNNVISSNLFEKPFKHLLLDSDNYLVHLAS